MQFQDVTGRDIEIGDIILYTMSTHSSAAAMEAGRVTKFNPKSIVVQPVNFLTFDPLEKDKIDSVPTGEYRVYGEGTSYEQKYPIYDYVKNGTEVVQEQLIPKPNSYRFFILKKVGT